MEAVIHLPDVDIHDARAAVFPVRMGVPLHVEPELDRIPARRNMWVVQALQRRLSTCSALLGRLQKARLCDVPLADEREVHKVAPVHVQ